MRFLILIVLTASLFAARDIRPIREYRKEMNHLKNIYEKIDAEVDGFEFSTELSDSLKKEAKERIEGEMHNRQQDLITSVLSMAIRENEKIRVEENCILKISLNFYYSAALAALPEGNCEQLKAKILELKG